MTNEFDDLVSAYVDGQATPTEIARVESDPELMALARQWRTQAAALQSVPPADPSQRRIHIARALDAFDAPAVAPVVPLDPRRAQQRREQQAADPGLGAAQVDPARDARRRDRGGRVQWLGAAAAAVVVVGGLGWALNQSGSGDDDTFAAEAVEETEAFDAVDAAEADFDDAADDVAEDATALADEAVLDEAEVAEAAPEEESAADSASDADAEAGGATEGFFGDGVAGESSDTDGSTPSRGGFFLDGSTVVFETSPDPDTLDSMAQTQRFQPVDTSACGAAVAAPEPDLELRGWIPISVGGEPGEALVFEGPGDALVVLAVNGVCQQFG